MSYETIRYEVEDGIATATLARPERLNAITGRMLADLLAMLDQVDADDDVRALIVTGEGRAFSAGADLYKGADTFASPGGAPPDYADEASRDNGGRVSLRLFNLLKPVIGAINGPAVGLGATLTLPMDIRLASETARYGFVFARRGMVPEAASSFFLPRLVGISRALAWCYSGRLIDADEALAGGLVSAVLASGDLLPEARRLAHEMTDGGAPVSIALTRQMMWRGLGMAHPMEAHRIDSRGILARGASADAKEGVASFLERRPAVFSDRVGKNMPDYFPWWDEPQFR